MSARRGKSSGIKNFTQAEDVYIAKAYAMVTSDASVGTDQDGEVYYKRIGDAFNENIKDQTDFIQDRSWESVRSRWLNVVQKSLLKFAGCFNKALSEYHSGWALDDYMILAKEYYLSDVKKAFQGDLCWAVVKNLPKFAIDPAVLTKEMRRALLLDEDEVPALATASSARLLSMAARPEVGKKKAKKTKFESPNFQSPSSASSFDDRQRVFDRLAASNELRSSIAKDRFTMQLFAQDQQQTPEAIEFRKLKQQQALLDARIEVEKKKLELQLLQQQNRSHNFTAPDEYEDSTTQEELIFNGEAEIF
jgi:hypothetical protein